MRQNFVIRFIYTVCCVIYYLFIVHDFYDLLLLGFYCGPYTVYTPELDITTRYCCAIKTLNMYLLEKVSNKIAKDFVRYLLCDSYKVALNQYYFIFATEKIKVVAGGFKSKLNKNAPKSLN